MSKKLCASRQHYTDKQYIKKVKNAHYLCTKCGRAAREKKHLCQDQPLQ